MSILWQSNARAPLNCLGCVVPISPWSWCLGRAELGDRGEDRPSMPVLSFGPAECLAVVCIPSSRERCRLCLMIPTQHRRRFRLRAGSSWGMVAAWLPLCGLSVSTQQCSEPLMIMWCFSWGEKSLLKPHFSLPHTPFQHSVYWMRLIDYLAGFSSHYQRAHSVYVAGLSCSVTVICYSIRKGKKKCM